MRNPQTQLSLPRRAIEAASWMFFYGLSANLLLATVAALSYFGVAYRVGYETHVAKATLFPGSADSTVWLLVTGVTVASALLLTAGTRARERVGWILYSFVAVLGVGLYADGQTTLAYGVSLLLTLSFLSTTLMLPTWSTSKMKFLNSNGFFMTVTGFFVLLVVIESSALISRVGGLLIGTVALQALTSIQALQDELSGSLSAFSTILMLAAILVWVLALPLILHTPRYRTAPVRKKERSHDPARLFSFIMLGLALVLAVLVPLAPYASSVQLRGVDTRFYYQELAATSSFADAVSRLGVEPRQPYILALYMVQRLTGWDSLHVTIFGPVLLQMAFAFTSYLLTRELTQDWLTAGVAAVLSSSSMHTAVGLYAGIYANWFAMSAGILFIYFLEKSLTKPTMTLTLLTTLTSYALAFLHAWTWAIMLTAAFVGVGLMSLGFFVNKKTEWRNFIRTRGPVLLLASSPVLLVVVAAATGILPGLSSAIAYGLFGIGGSMSPTRLSFIYPTLSFTMRWYVGSLLAYPPLLILAALGGIWIAFSELRAASLLIGWLLTTSVAAMLLDSWYQWRVLNVIPFELLASIGLLGALAGVDWAAKPLGPRGSRLVPIFKLLLVAVILTDSVNYVFRADVILPMAT